MVGPIWWMLDADLPANNYAIFVRTLWVPRDSKKLKNWISSNLEQKQLIIPPFESPEWAVHVGVKIFPIFSFCQNLWEKSEKYGNKNFNGNLLTINDCTLKMLSLFTRVYDSFIC